MLGVSAQRADRLEARDKRTQHRGTENTEIAQRIELKLEV
jgi:hypothetical protein